MGLIPVLMGGNIGYFLGSFLGTGFRDGCRWTFLEFTKVLPDDIDRRWYNIVGVPILVNVFCNIFVPHIKTVIGPLKMKIMVATLGKSQVLQEDLNQM
jgi:hypothetical protein